MFDESEEFLPACLMADKVNYFNNLFTAGYGYKEVTKARNLKAVMRFNKSSSADRGFLPNKYIYDYDYGKPTYTSLDHFKPAKDSIYKVCADNPELPGEDGNLMLCTNSTYNSVCAGRQLIYSLCFFNLLLFNYFHVLVAGDSGGVSDLIIIDLLITELINFVLIFE